MGLLLLHFNIGVFSHFACLRKLLINQLQFLFPPLWVSMCLFGKEAVAVVVKLVHSSVTFNLNMYFSCLFLIPLQVTSRWIPLINERTDKDSRCLSKDEKCELGCTSMGVNEQC